MTIGSTRSSKWILGNLAWTRKKVTEYLTHRHVITTITVLRPSILCQDTQQNRRSKIQVYLPVKSRLYDPWTSQPKQIKHRCGLVRAALKSVQHHLDLKVPVDDILSHRLGVSDFLVYPNHMANTKSSLARVRPQSVARKRMQFEKLGSTKKFVHGFWDANTISERGSTKSYGGGR